MHPAMYLYLHYIATYCLAISHLALNCLDLFRVYKVCVCVLWLLRYTLWSLWQLQYIYNMKVTTVPVEAAQWVSSNHVLDVPVFHKQC